MNFKWFTILGALLILASLASATAALDVNFLLPVNGGRIPYISASSTENDDINFTIHDLNDGITQTNLDVNIWYSRVGYGTRESRIITDANLLDGSTIVCSPDYNISREEGYPPASSGTITCIYSWSGITSVNPGEYILDIEIKDRNGNNLASDQRRTMINAHTLFGSSTCGLINMIYLVLIAAMVIAILVGVLALNNGADFQTVIIGAAVVVIIVIFIMFFLGALHGSMCVNFGV